MGVQITDLYNLMAAQTVGRKYKTNLSCSYV